MMGWLPTRKGWLLGPERVEQARELCRDRAIWSSLREEEDTMDVVSEVKEILREVLQLGERADTLDSQSALFGSLPELDSLAVASVMVALEDRFGIVVDDDVTADHFETLGSLARFTEQHM